jgi:hypothetical protein
MIAERAAGIQQEEIMAAARYRVVQCSAIREMASITKKVMNANSGTRKPDPNLALLISQSSLALGFHGGRGLKISQSNY